MLQARFQPAHTRALADVCAVVSCCMDAAPSATCLQRSPCRAGGTRWPPVRAFGSLFSGPATPWIARVSQPLPKSHGDARRPCICGGQQGPVAQYGTRFCSLSPYPRSGLPLPTVFSLAVAAGLVFIEGGKALATAGALAIFKVHYHSQSLPERQVLQAWCLSRAARRSRRRAQTRSCASGRPAWTSPTPTRFAPALPASCSYHGPAYNPSEQEVKSLHVALLLSCLLARCSIRSHAVKPQRSPNACRPIFARTSIVQKHVIPFLTVRGFICLQVEARVRLRSTYVGGTSPADGVPIKLAAHPCQVCHLSTRSTY